MVSLTSGIEKCLQTTHYALGMAQLSNGGRPISTETSTLHDLSFPYQIPGLAANGMFIIMVVLSTNH